MPICLFCEESRESNVTSFVSGNSREPGKAWIMCFSSTRSVLAASIS